MIYLNLTPIMYVLLLLVLLVTLLLPAVGFNFPQFRAHARTLTGTAMRLSVPKGSDKIRVKLLDNVNAVGKKGDVVMVSRAQWLNFLQPKKVAVQITDIQLAKMQQEVQTTSLKQDLEHKELFSSISSLPVLRLTHKAGPKTHLFGAVTAKTLLDSIKQNLPAHVQKCFVQKSITIRSIAERVTSANKGHAATGLAKMEIRKVGLFEVTLQLPENRTAVVKIEVAPQ